MAFFTYCVPKDNLLTFEHVKESGIIQTHLGDKRVSVGEVILNDGYKTFVVSSTYFKENFVHVKKEPSKKNIDIESLMSGYIEMGQIVKESSGENHIFEIKVK